MKARLIAPRLIARCAALLALCGACGAAPEEPKSPAEATVDESQGQATSLPPVTLTPVSAPESLIAVARLSSAPTAADAVMSWLGLPVDWREQLDAAAPGVKEALAAGGAVEFAAILDPDSLARPKIHFALSVPMSSREAGLELAQARGWSVERMSAAAHFVDAGRPCALAASLGTAKARWVCSESRQAVEAMLPYMTRGLPNETLPAKTLYATVRAEPFRKRFGKRISAVKMMGVPFLLREVSLDNPTFDNAMADAAHAVADELVSLAEKDLKAINLVVDVKPDAGAAIVQLDLELQGSASWLSKAFASAAAREMAPPERFWAAAPGLEASYSSSADPELTRGIATTLGKLVRGYLEHLGTTPRVAQSVASAVEGLPSARGPAVSVTKPPQTVKSWAGVLGFEYSILHTQADSEAVYSALTDALVALINDAKFRQGLGRVHEVDAASLPRAKQRKVVVDGLPATEWSWEISPGQLAALDKRENTKQELGPLLLTALAVRDGEASWLAMGVGQQDLAGETSALRKAAPQAHPQLGILRSTKNSYAGYMPTKSLLLSAMEGAFDRELEGMSVDSVLRAMPSGGTAPVIMRATASSTGPTGSLYLYLPKAALQDVAAATMSVIAGSK